jgi:hypothetical protein
MGDESHENNQRQKNFKNEIELDSAEDQVVPKKVKKLTEAFLGCVECSTQPSHVHV